MSDERKLATIEKIKALDPIPNADAIEVATIRNWKVVVRKGDFAVGDQCVYFEVDSALPLDNPLFAFLGSRGVKTIDGKDYHVLRTVKLRGQVSQGLIIPVPQNLVAVGTDVTDYFQVIKYEKPIPKELSGTIIGSFPIHIIPKTDAERVQNLSLETYAEYVENRQDWYPTVKIDGMSRTYIFTEKGMHICSRNWEITPTPELADFTAMKGLNWEKLTPGFVIQAELYGEGIQGNPLKVKGVHVAVFTVAFARNFAGPAFPLGRRAAEFWAGEARIPWVPELDYLLPGTIDQCLVLSDGLRHPEHGTLAEGIVWHHRKGEHPPFKAINNAYLLKAKD